MLSKLQPNASMLLSGEEKDWRKRDDKFVYFNSNKYHGNPRSMNSEASHLTSLSNQLLNQNAHQILSGAESRLLKAMVHYASARLAMKAALANRANSPTLIEWSTPEREWLFHCLTESPGHEPLPLELQERGSATELLNYLRTRPDAPDGAFATALNSNIQNNETNTDGNTWFDTTDVDDYVNEKRRKSTLKGSLDDFFLESEDFMNSKLAKHAVSHDERAELTIQEAVATMLKAAAMNRLSRIKNEWKIASDSLFLRKAQKEDDDKETANDPKDNLPFDHMPTDELEKHFTKLGEEMLESMAVVRELSDSLNELGRRLLDYCSTDGLEGRVSRSKQDELAKMLQEHVDSLPDDRETPGYDEDYVFGSDEFRDEIDPKYGSLSNHSENIEDEDVQEDEALFESIFE